MSELPIRRHALILQNLEQHEGVRTTELATQLDVTRETIRNDLAHLARRGLLRLVHGGAVAIAQHEPALSDRLTENAKGKAAIAARAAALVPDGARVVLDSGSTTQALGRELQTCSGLKIWTSDITIALDLMGRADVTLLGGQLNPKERSVGGHDAIEMMSGYSTDFAFVSLGGLSEDQGPSDFDRSGLVLRQAMLDSATQGFFLADQTKFDRNAPLRWKKPHKAQAVICDVKPGPGIQGLLLRHELSLIAA